jgi:dTDP-4-amino-4,6-dideoxygalactose transaminase
MPVDWSMVEAVAREFGVLIIEDAAQGHGASWRSRPLGSLAPISILSFSRGKGWTGGHGGAVLFRAPFRSRPKRPAPASVREDLVNLAGLGIQWAFGRPSVYGIPRSIPALALGETRYHEPTEVAAMVRSAAGALIASHKATVRESEQRRAIGKQLLHRLEHLRSLEVIQLHDGAIAGYLRFPLRRPGGFTALADAPAALRMGIAPSYPQLLSELDPLRSVLIASPREFRGGAELVRDLLTLPTHSRVTQRGLEEIIAYLGLR